MNTTETQTPLYSRLTGMVAWTGGMEAVREGVPYTGHPMLPIERPDLFSSEPLPARSGAVAPQPHCWTCREAFAPKQGSQRYCSRECRRARENELSRAIRLTNRAGKPASIPRGADTLDELETQRALVRKLVYNLGGWIESREDHTVDEIRLDLPDKVDLLRKAKVRYGELTKFINDERHARQKNPTPPGVNLDPRTVTDANQRQLTDKARTAAWEAYAAALGGN